MLLADGETTTLLLTMLVKAVADLVMMQISKAQHAVLFIVLVDTILILQRLKDPFLSRMQTRGFLVEIQILGAIR